MNPDLLKTFLAICKHRSFTRAGQDRLLTQPAISRQIQQLESQLGVSLFDRIGKSIELTDAARALLPHATELLGRMERMVEALRGHQDATHGRLRIGASTTPGLYLLPEIIGRFHRSHPEVEISYVVQNSLEIERRIVENEIDMGFVGGHISDKTLVLEPLGNDEVVCFCASAHPLAGKRSITAASLQGETWIAREKGSATRQVFERWAVSAGCEMKRVIELSSPEGIKALVRAGLGVSFMSLAGLREDLRAGSITCLPIRGVHLVRPILIVIHPGKHLSPVMTQFLALARNSHRDAWAE